MNDSPQSADLGDVEDAAERFAAVGRAGWIAKGLIGKSMIKFAESLVNRMPVVRSIYSGAKQIAETVFVQAERSFEKACLIQYPRKGIWAIGFISTTAKGEVTEKAETSGEMLSVFVPTTPNPTSGFLLFFPKEDVIELDMSIEDAAKLVISAGLVYPGQSSDEEDDAEEVGDDSNSRQNTLLPVKKHGTTRSN